ncbi:hypothetical protein [Massilia soli]|uniref:Uncharacterized protein n=1 Tax=Massilia soli TaxID=2792854 RepID=A0ABS7SK09_9BURK|nr:hypothetical protein [Massilia soli]MBZ2206528.1 hypothetical protein [Massilia soli]
MINKEAVETMTQMLALITKYSKGAFPEVETEASSESRRRAWAVTCMLARFAELVAKSDMYFVLADDPYKTDAERNHCYQIARQVDRGFMRELSEFQKCAEEFKNEPVTGKLRTDNDIVRELEVLLQDVKVLQQFDENLVVSPGTKVSKKERERKDANRAVIAEQLENVRLRLETTENLARTRGIVVALNRHRTVIKRLPVPNIKPATSATKTKKAPVLKLVTTGPAPRTKAKTAPSKKSA